MVGPSQSELSQYLVMSLPIYCAAIHVCHHNVGFIGIKCSYRPFLTIFHTVPIHIHNQGIQLVGFLPSLL